MWTSIFWRAVIERALMAAMAAVLAVLTADGVGVISDVDFVAAVDVAGLAALISLAKSLLVAGATDGTPALGPETLPGRHARR